jgi:two-component system response regulator DevR
MSIVCQETIHLGAAKSDMFRRGKERQAMESSLSSECQKEQSIRLRHPIRVVLIDDSIFALYGLKTVLSRTGSIGVVGTARTEAEAFAAIEACRPDVVVLDVRVGRANGIEMCRTIRHTYPNIAVLFFALSEDLNLLHAAILAGAQGYLLKNASGESVAESIEIVFAGQAIIDRQLTRQIITWIRDGAGATPHQTMESCSREDCSILSLVAAGKTNKEIARELNVALSLVTTRLQRIYKRLKISRRSEAARCFAQAEKGVTH